MLRFSLVLSTSILVAATAACFSSARRLASSRAALILAATAFTRLFSESLEGLGICPTRGVGKVFSPGWLPPAGLAWSCGWLLLLLLLLPLLLVEVGALGEAVALVVVPDLVLLEPPVLLLLPVLPVLPGLLICAAATTCSALRGWRLGERRQIVFRCNDLKGSCDNSVFHDGIQALHLVINQHGRPQAGQL